MDILQTIFSFFWHIIDFAIHINEYLPQLLAEYGLWLMLILFLIIFAETGFVFTPFLPGDSLLFVAGSLCAAGGMNVWVLTILLFIAAFLGDSLNYWIGKNFGRRILDGSLNRFVNQRALNKTKEYFDRNGGKTILLARFIPLIRTFAPFVAGTVEMKYKYFMAWNITGAFIWIYSITLVGYFLGLNEFVQKNFSLVILAIIIISLIPVAWEILKVIIAKFKS